MTIYDLCLSLQGKTSIINALMSKSNTSARIHEDARTVGINIQKWAPYPDAAAGDEASLSFSVLDLAGQAIYALSHQVSFACLQLQDIGIELGMYVYETFLHSPCVAACIGQV